MSFLTPTAAWLALLLIPLIAFYFLKLKRPRQEVPSLVLWRQVLNDQRVNSPFQRFKRNLLLLLQILLILLLVFAAMQPFLRGDTSRSDRIPILIDLSASMAALDKEGGESRLELAKAKAEEIIGGMLQDEEICLIGFGLTARQATPFTDNKSELRAALKKMQVEDVPGRIDDALRLAQAISRTEPFPEAILITDGNLPGEAAVDLPFAIRFQKIDTGGANIGITNMSARRSGDGSWEVFAQIEASDSGTVAVARLWAEPTGDDPEAEPVQLGEDTVTVDLTGSTRLTFLIPSEGTSKLRLELTPDGFDSLDADNIAHLDLPPLRDLRAYIPSRLAGYSHAVGLMENVLVDDTPDAGTSYDLVISDDEEEVLSYPAPVALVVGKVPEKVAPLISETTAEGNAVIDWRRDSPLLRYVDFTEVVLTDLPKLAEEVTDEDFEAQGFRVIAHGRLGPLILAEQNSSESRYYLLFHTDRSTLPYRLGFPILCSNLVSLAREYAGLAEIEAHKTGVMAGIPAAPSTDYTVEPGGAKVSSDRAGNISGFAARKTGRYLFNGGGRQISAGASLLSTSETKLQSVDKISTREYVADAETDVVRSDKPLWFPLALIALAVLLLEWWYFNRKRGRVAEDGLATPSIGARRSGARS